MIAFHNDKKIKTKYLNRVVAHRKADELVKGNYWQNGKGCAVGCTIHGSSHKAYETELGIPEWLARLEDRTFENLSDKDAMVWPEKFLKAIPVGVDLEQVKRPFLIFIVEESLKNFDHKKYPDTVVKVTDILNKLKDPKHKFADAAAAAAAYAADAAATAYAAAATAYAAAAAAAARYRYYGYSSKHREKAFKKYADKLLELMKACK